MGHRNARPGVVVLKRIFCLLCLGSLLPACSDGTLESFSSDSSLSGAAGSGSDSGAPGGLDPDTTMGPQVFTTTVIDDFEDGDTRVTEDSEGWWYIFNDSTGVQDFVIEDVSGERSSSTYAAHTFGERFTAWGAGLGVDLAGIQDARRPDEPFDASQFAGISFWARVGAASVRQVRVDLLSPCGDGCATYSGVTIELVPEWRQYTVLFSELEPRQAESGFDQSRLMHIQYFFLSPESFDLLVDDLAVVSKYSIK